MGTHTHLVCNNTLLIFIPILRLMYTFDVINNLKNKLLNLT